MRFQKITDIQPVVAYITDTLITHLEKGERVTWLVPGGSAITIAAVVSKNLSIIDTSRLSVSLTDERFGPVGHSDSNWRQLAEHSFSLPQAHTYPVLRDKELRETVDEYGELLRQLIDQADFSIGLFGMGADGHTAGILPKSPAIHDEHYAGGYDADKFVRLTMTPIAISHLDETVLCAMGYEKLAALTSLQQELLPIDVQPAQIHKQVPKSTIFNDQIGDTV